MRLYTIGDFLGRYDLVIYKLNERVFAGELVDDVREWQVAIRRHYGHSENEIILYFLNTYFGRENALNRIRRTVLHGGKAAGARIRFSEYP